MRKRISAGACLLLAAAWGLQALAQAPAAEDFPELRVTGVDQPAVTRGREVYRAQCVSCHAADQRGTRRGSDLSRSVLLYNDTTGAELGAFLKRQHGQQVERVSFPALTDAQASDGWKYLRASIRVVAARSYAPPSILVGDARAGQAYFNGKGRCSGCHSPTGDLAGIGARYEPPMLQGYILMPQRLPTPAVPGEAANARTLRATVSAPGAAPVTGELVRLTLFEVQITDLATGARRSWEIKDGQPKVAITDPLQGHYTVRRTLTDTDMHNLTAYLAGLK